MFLAITIFPLGNQGRCFSCHSSPLPPGLPSRVCSGKSRQAMDVGKVRPGRQAGCRGSLAKGKPDPTPQRGLRDTQVSRAGAESSKVSSNSVRDMGLRNGAEAQLPREERTNHAADWWETGRHGLCVIHSPTCCLALEKRSLSLQNGSNDSQLW